MTACARETSNAPGTAAVFARGGADSGRPRDKKVVATGDIRSQPTVSLTILVASPVGAMALLRMKRRLHGLAIALEQATTYARARAARRGAAWHARTLNAGTSGAAARSAARRGA